MSAREEERNVKANDSTRLDFCWAPETTAMVQERLPRRRDLAGETAATLKEWIRAGVLKEVLPGELRLKTRLRVGRDTLRLALRRLTQEGWVSPPAKGKRRRTQGGFPPARNRAAAEPLPVTVLSPHPIEHTVAPWEWERTQVLLAGQGRNLRFISLHEPERRPLARLVSISQFSSRTGGRRSDFGGQLERLVQAHPSAAWILVSAGEALQRWFAQHCLPTFLYGAPSAGVDLPFLAPDWERAAFHAGTQLARQGHQVIGLLEGAEHQLAFLTGRRGLERALAAAEPQGRLAVFEDNGSPASVARCLESAFGRQERPTALVLSHADQLLTCYSWLASRGIQVPTEVSIISLGSDPWFRALHPPVCHYQPDFPRISHCLAERVLELAATGRVVGKSLRIRLKYIRGATLGLAPRAGGGCQVGVGAS